MADDAVEYAEASGGPKHGIGGLLDELNFDENAMFLTERQAVVLAMRELGDDQGTIAKRLDCSRANVSNIERSARENIEKARATLSFAELLSAPVRVDLPADLPLHEAPERIYERCDDAGVKVNYGAPELIRQISAETAGAERRGRLTTTLVVKVSSDGDIHVLTPQ